MSRANRPVDLAWNDRFDPILKTLNERIASRGKAGTLNIRLATRALLTLLKNGTQPTPIEVVDYVYNNDTPGSGYWIDFDYDKWTKYVPRIVTMLKSDRPEDVLGKS